MHMKYCFSKAGDTSKIQVQNIVQKSKVMSTKPKVSTLPALRGILTCGVCKVAVADELEMKKHSRHFNCFDCDFITILEEELDEHINEKHSNSILPD